MLAEYALPLSNAPVAGATGIEDLQSAAGPK